jgi:hypothetical protein
MKESKENLIIVLSIWAVIFGSLFMAWKSGLGR